MPECIQQKTTRKREKKVSIPHCVQKAFRYEIMVGGFGLGTEKNTHAATNDNKKFTGKLQKKVAFRLKNQYGATCIDVCGGEGGRWEQ